MHTTAVLHTHVDTFFSIDLDTCAELNVVDIEFVKRHNLLWIGNESPRIRFMDSHFAKVFGVYQVPVSLTDPHGCTRKALIPCTAVQRNSLLDDSPVILGMPALSQLGILLFPQTQSWWFVQETDVVKLTNPKKFLKQCRREARVFAVLIHPNAPTALFPDEEEAKTPRKTDEIPPELMEFKDVMDISNSDILPSFKPTDHKIDLLPNTTPPVGPIYPLSRNQLLILHNYLEENLAKGRIRPSESPAASPVLFIPKKDGTLRLCVDYRGLNKITVKNRYPLPLISEILDRAAGAKFFTKLDVKDAYYRIRIRKGDEWKTAFRTRYGLFEYLVMPFGLTNAPATFQSYIHQALGGLLDEFCIVYLDDILIFSPDRDTHTEHIRRVLARLRKAQLYCKPSKCSFYKDQVEFLGYIVNREGIAMDPERIRTIQDWPEPQTFRDVQVFLGFCNFYRKFIRGYSEIALPLTSLMKGMEAGKKFGDFRLDSETRAAFQRLKEEFQHAPILRHFDPNKSIILETDASDFAMGAVLSQEAEDHRKHPVAFWSAKFSGPTKNYSTPDHEMMAIVEAFKHWRHYLEGSRYPITVFSDHNNLQGFMKQNYLNGRQARWCMYLAGFDFTIKHQAGKRNPADGPSRRPDYYDEDSSSQMCWLPTIQNKMDNAEKNRQRDAVDSGMKPPSVSGSRIFVYSEDPEDAELVEDGLPQPTMMRKDAEASARLEGIFIPNPSQPLIEVVKNLQQNDSTTQKIKERLTNSRRSARDTVTWHLGLAGELLYQEKLFVPEEQAIKQELLQRYHDDPLAGHFGSAKTLELLQRKYYWPRMAADVKEYCKTCHVCQTGKPRRHRVYGSLESLPIPKRPWSEITMDFIVGFPTVIGPDGLERDAILVVVDRYTKMCRFFAMNTTMKSQELAELLHREIELKYGIPDGCVSDRGSVFTSQFWSDLCYLNKVHRKLSTAFHPQTDGQTERMNQTLIQYLRCYASEHPTIWATILPEAEFVCNNTKSATTQLTPFQALMGYNPTMSRRIEGEAPSEGAWHPNAQERLVQLQRIRTQLEQHWAEAVANQKRYYDAKHQKHEFRKGQLVLLSTRNLKLKTSPKFTPKFIGPFRVLECVGSLAYRLALPEKYSRLHNVFPVSLLEPWHARSQEDSQQMPMPELEDDEEWEVEEVREEKRIDGETLFFIKWKGWPSEFNQWVPEEDMMNARRMIDRFRREQEQKSRKRKEMA